MSDLFYANITWLKFEDGGRKVILPEGYVYAPLIEFINNTNTSLKKSSVIIKCEKTIDYQMKNVEVKFLSKNLIKEISKGDKFNLYEGKRKIAFGIVILS